MFRIYNRVPHNFWDMFHEFLNTEHIDWWTMGPLYTRGLETID